MKVVMTLLTAGIGSGSFAAHAEPIGPANPDADPAHGCIEFHTTYRWQAIDDSRLVIWAWHASDAYLVETTIPLTELRGGQRVDFVDGDEDGQLCGAHGDKIVVAGKELSQQTSIATLTRLDSEQIAQMIEQPLSNPKPTIENTTSSKAPPECIAASCGISAIDPYAQAS